MTARFIYGKGLIAGLSYSEMRNHMLPGEIIDMYAWRARYDAALASPRLVKKIAQ